VKGKTLITRPDKFFGHIIIFIIINIISININIIFILLMLLILLILLIIISIIKIIIILKNLFGVVVKFSLVTEGTWLRMPKVTYGNPYVIPFL